MSSRNGLTSAIRAHLREHGEQTASQVHDAMVAKGLVTPDAKNVSAILSQRLAAGEFGREFVDGRVRYSLNPDHQQSEKGEGARLAAELASAPPVSGAFGTTCRVDPKQRAKNHRREEFLDALGDDETTVNDLALRLPGWMRQDVLAELRELAQEGRLRTRDDAKSGRLYWLVEPDDGGVANATRADDVAEPLPPVAQIERTAPSSPERRVAVVGDTLSDGALRARVAAIAADLEEVLDDALDERVSNDLLRDLLLASLGANRALRRLDR